MLKKPKKKSFDAMKVPKNDIMDAKNINVLVGEN